MYSLGDYADEVLLIQERLSTLGYLEAQPDGEFGAQTETAVKGFQKNNELEETGVVDEVTYNTPFSDEAVKMTESEEKVDDIEKANVNKPVVKTAAAAAATTPNTAVEKKSSEITTRSLAGVTNSVETQKNAKSTNYEFLLWLAIMIVVMLITFSIVFTIEKKKARKAARSRRFY